MDSSPNYIDWKIVTTLPQEAGTLHLGLAGPVAGILDDKLIIAGGANFPELCRGKEVRSDTRRSFTSIS
ncbi:hypothetical protein [Sphingobacterium sp. T2]|uniref:hypothetical protein n=1 Tax=Sphingobacterium sp. T2 TaxID=1590596 RepID=UPI0018CD42DC|nr:hypothetical protein [Sphingobacterium sp. T2]